jgi:hypothetical protein
MLVLAQYLPFLLTVAHDWGWPLPKGWFTPASSVMPHHGAFCSLP